MRATPNRLLGGALLAVAGRQPEVAELVVNQWIQLVAADPGTGTMHVFEDGRFVPYEPAPTLLPVVERSAEWHMRSRDHLPPALVRRALPDQVGLETLEIVAAFLEDVHYVHRHAGGEGETKCLHR